MKQRIITLAVAGAVGGATAAVGSAEDGGHGGNVVSSQQQVRAHFRSVQGTETTEATIRVSRDFSREGGTETTATIELQRFDPTRSATPLVLYRAECPPDCVIPESAIRINDASHARLDVTLRLQEQTSLQFRRVTFQLVWQGVGQKTKQRSVSRDGGVKRTTVFAARQAVASGTISDGSNDFVKGPSDQADMQSVTTRESRGGDRDDDDGGDDD